jgi:carbon-monoxide dehydrogenase medium subunit
VTCRSGSSSPIREAEPPPLITLMTKKSPITKRFEPGAVNGHRVDPAGLSSDIHAEAAFRAHLISVMAKRAVATALANS